MNSTRVIAHLNRAYRSVLKKCFLINAGIFGVVLPVHAEYNNIAEAVADVATPREYILSADENVTVALGNMGGTSATLTIDGSSAKYGISGNNVSGITVSSGNTLVLQNLGSVIVSGDGKSVSDYIVSSSVNGFKSSSVGFVNNGGTLTVSDVVFSNNESTNSGGAIGNTGTITGITNATFIGNSADYGAAINNNSGGTIGNISGEFINNSASSESYILGGIINNGYTGYSKIGDVSADFKNNTVVAKNGYYIIGAMIENGAALKATLAQGIVGFKQSATIQLLNANNTDFNNFTDIFDNNMYHFEKANKNGLYRITMMKSAEDILEEAGAQDWVATAAHDYVDIGGFSNGTVAADIADKLTSLAQNDLSALVKEIKALAPTEASTVQSNVANNTSRLFKTVDNYLRGERDPLGVSSGDEIKGVGIWAKPYIGTTKVNNKGDVEGYDSDSKGVIVGVEKKLTKDWKLGLGLQYDETDMNAASRDIDITSTLGFVYGEFKPSNWFVNAVVSYGVSDYDEDKHILGAKYAAHYDVRALSFASVTGYQFNFVTPEIGMRYYRIKQGEYTDGAQQHVGKITAEIWRAVAGVRFAKDFGMFRPDIYLGVTYDAKNGKKRVPVSLTNGTNYIVPGESLKSIGYETNVGFMVNVNEHLRLGATYMGTYKEKYQDHTAMLKLKYEF